MSHDSWGSRTLEALARFPNRCAKFRRQHSIGPYVLDFYCPAHKIAIELDGAGHYLLSGAEADAQRTSYLNSKGIRVLRFENKEVFEDASIVVSQITDMLSNPTPEK